MDSLDDRYSLKWSNFRSNFTDGFHDFLQKEMMVDVTLAAEGKFVQAHKLVLSVCSPYFKSLFKVNPCKHPIVILKDVGHCELSNMLQFMYKGEVGVKHEDLPSFLKLADTLKVRGLAEDKIQIEKNNVARKDVTSMTRVRMRKRKRKAFLADFNDENSDSELYVGDKKESKIKRVKNRRLTSQLDTVKKMKNRDCEEKSFESVSVSKKSVEVSGDSDSDGYGDDNPLANLLIDKIQTDEDKMFNLSNVEIKNDFCDDESNGGGDNKKVFDDYEDDDRKSNVSIDEMDDFETIRNSCSGDNLTEADQTPQGIKSKRRLKQSVIWSYYRLKSDHVECKACGKSLKGIKTTNAESHLTYVHPALYKEFCRRKWKKRRPEEDTWVTQNPRNPLWMYFMRRDKDLSRLQCIACNKFLKFVPGYSNPSNLVRHLKLHVELYTDYQQRKSEKGAVHPAWKKFFE